mgnify:CR=1 FL=1
MDQYSKLPLPWHEDSDTALPGMFPQNSNFWTKKISIEDLTGVIPLPL